MRRQRREKLGGRSRSSAPRQRHGADAALRWARWAARRRGQRGEGGGAGCAGGPPVAPREGRTDARTDSKRGVFACERAYARVHVCEHM